MMTVGIAELCGISGALRLISARGVGVTECAYLLELLGGVADMLSADLDAHGVTDSAIAELDELGGALKEIGGWREMEGACGYLCKKIAARCEGLAATLDAMS